MKIFTPRIQHLAWGFQLLYSRFMKHIFTPTPLKAVCALFVLWVGLIFIAPDVWAVGDNDASTIRFADNPPADRNTGISTGTALLLLGIVGLAYLFWQDFKKKTKARIIKLTLNLIALVMAPPAPWVSAFYTGIRILWNIIMGLRGIIKRQS